MKVRYSHRISPIEVGTMLSIHSVKYIATKDNQLLHEGQGGVWESIGGG